jgi:hypothetical protein
VRGIGRPLPVVLAGLALAILPAPALAQQGDCWTMDPPPPSERPHPLRFGITPQVAGHAGGSQGEAAPVDEAAAGRALHRLRPENRELVLRLNRLFWADGEAGIRRFAGLVDGYAAAGFRSELQVRYHPPAGREGDVAGFVRWVRSAVRQLARRRAVTALSITNEANLPISPNTSDGAHPGVLDALVQGTVAARQEAVALGRPELPIGFTVMWRWTPEADDRFWEELGRRATPEFRRALTYVGLQLYPGLVWPPAPLPGRSAGQEVVEALSLVRTCYMPKAGLGDEVALWVSENGYATNQGRDEQRQVADLDSTVRHVHRWSGALGVTDYRWFNLRDNRSDGSDMFDAVGLLRDDYSEKPAFASFRGLVGLFGTRAPGSEVAGARPRPRVRFAVSPARDTRGPRRFTLRGELRLPAGLGRSAGCRGVVSVRYKAGRRTISSRRAAVRPDCRFTSRVTFTLPWRFGAQRRLRVLVRYEGSPSLRRSGAAERSVRVR